MESINISTGCQLRRYHFSHCLYKTTCCLASKVFGHKCLSGYLAVDHMSILSLLKNACYIMSLFSTWFTIAHLLKYLHFLFRCELSIACQSSVYFFALQDTSLYIYMKVQFHNCSEFYALSLWKIKSKIQSKEDAKYMHFCCEGKDLQEVYLMKWLFWMIFHKSPSNFSSCWTWQRMGMSLISNTSYETSFFGTFSFKTFKAIFAIIGSWIRFLILTVHG